jgi:hypothetical protein
MSDASDANGMSPSGQARSLTPGDVPDSVRRRYHIDGRSPVGMAFYVDATLTTPAFRDRGARLTTDGADPSAVRHMMEIAAHRGWTIVLVRGGRDFRREAWLAGRAQNLEVHGYRPTLRDLEALQRRLEAERPHTQALKREPPHRSRSLEAPPPGLTQRLNVVESVVRGRVRDRREQERILAAARARFAFWLERGATFPELRGRERGRRQQIDRSRDA